MRSIVRCDPGEGIRSPRSVADSRWNPGIYRSQERQITGSAALPKTPVAPSFRPVQPPSVTGPSGRPKARLARMQL